MKIFFKWLFQQKNEINYLYFSFFALFLCFLSFAHYLNWETPLFFLLYAFGQALLEVCFFILIACLLKQWAPKWVNLFYVGVSFLLLLLHFTHFTMVRLMDASIGYIFKFLFGSGVDHLVAGLQALNMNKTMVGLIIGTFFFIPALGIGFYWLTSRASNRKPLHLSLFQVCAVFTSIGLSLFLIDYFALPSVKRHVYSKYQKTLPLGTTFLSPSPHFLTLLNPLRPARDENTIAIPEVKLSHKPNIYLFVIETLRSDYVNETISPHLTQFAKEHIQIPHSYANSNSTHTSWFSIFHSNLPFNWAETRDQWKQGSIPLRFLKKMGYQIHVYSSADLRYFNMDNLLFGSKRRLLDKVEEYTTNRSLEPCDRDALAFASLKQNLAKEGHLYVIFLDSTHSEYSFPKNAPPPFTPIAKEVDYLTIGAKSPELELLKNRYRNAIHYIDQLIGDFFNTLKKNETFDNSIIAITGDHGEEFFEEGALFHGTHINSYQTRVPLFLKFPSSEWTPQTQLATHIDLFPSILHYLTKESDFSSLFDGQSIFSLNHIPFRVAVQQNGADKPIEFCLEKSDLKFHARFTTPTQLEIIELQGLFEPATVSPLLEKI